MAQALISRKGGGSGYATVTFNNVSPLAKTTAPDLSAVRDYLVATTVGDYALFGGGHSNGYSQIAYALAVISF